MSFLFGDFDEGELSSSPATTLTSATSITSPTTTTAGNTRHNLPLSVGKKIRPANAKLTQPKSASTPTKVPGPSTPSPSQAVASDRVASTDAGTDSAEKQLIEKGESPPEPFFALHGLYNLGHTCYTNAVLQLLLSLSSFRQLLSPSATSHEGSDEVATKTALSSNADTLYSSLSDILTAKFMSTDPNACLDPRRDVDRILRSRPAVNILSLYEKIGRLSAGDLYDGSGTQHDAEELLTFILNTLDDEFAAHAVATSSTSSASHSSSHGSKHGGGNQLRVSRAGHGALDGDHSGEDDGDAGWQEIGSGKNQAVKLTNFTSTSTAVSRLCQGRYRSSVLKRSSQSDTSQPFFTLQVDIMGVGNMEDALKKTFAPETIHADGKTITKRLRIEALPDILFIQLKRFRYDDHYQAVKLVHNVDFYDHMTIPQELLVATTKNRKYKLIGVVFHVGTEAFRGHYTCATRSCVGWVHFNDQKVTRMTGHDIHFSTPTKQAYILMYSAVHQEYT